MERDINFYLDRALERSGCTSDRKLSLLLGKGIGAVGFYRARGVLPEDDTMLHLAKIAGIDPAIALLDLSSWRTEGEARLTYSKILQKITGCVLIGAALLPSPAYAFAFCPYENAIVYIMEFHMLH